MVTECNRHYDHAYVVRCAHFGNAVVTMRDYHHPDYMAFTGLPQTTAREPRFGVWGTDEKPWQVLADVETDDRDVADAAFRDAVAQLVGVEVAL